MRSQAAEHTSSSELRIVCVEDQQLFRDALTVTLHRRRDIELAGFAATEPEAIELIRRTGPDLVVLEPRAFSTGAAEAVARVRRLGLQHPIVVLTNRDGAEDIRRGFEFGAAAYLLKQATSATQLVATLRRVHQRRKVRPSRAVRARLKEASTTARLTERERQVLQLVMRGKRNSEIGEDLGIGVQTAQTHVRQILVKFNVGTRTAAVYRALRAGLVHMP